MKRNFLVVALLASGMVGLTSAPASAWGYWGLGCFGHFRPGHHMSRYVNVQVSLPYNAFTPFCGGHTTNYGVSNCGPNWGGCGPCAPSCGPMCGPMCGPVCGMPYGAGGASYAMQPMMGPMQYPGYAQMSPMYGPGMMPMQAAMPYQGYYGVQPAAYMPNYYPANPTEQIPMRNAFGN